MYNHSMKSRTWVFFLAVLLLVGCSTAGVDQLGAPEGGASREVTGSQERGDEQAPGVETGTGETEPGAAEPDTGPVQEPAEQADPTSGPDCYPEEVQHPIAEGIADQFEAITTYTEVMTWFCNGALFEDILNALMTEELSDIEAEDILALVAAGMTWEEIWKDLGISE